MLCMFVCARNGMITSPRDTYLPLRSELLVETALAQKGKEITGDVVTAINDLR